MIDLARSRLLSTLLLPMLSACVGDGVIFIGYYRIVYNSIVSFYFKFKHIIYQSMHIRTRHTLIYRIQGSSVCSRDTDRLLFKLAQNA